MQKLPKHILSFQVLIELDKNPLRLDLYQSLIVINPCSGYYLSMNRENRQVVTDELVEFEKQPVGVQDFGKNYQSFWRNLENIPQTNNESRKL
jgi:hypothetical protein